LETLKGRNYPTVISPHPGEAARLLKIDPEDIERDRFGSALELSKLTGAVVLLKGYYTIVMEQTGRFSVNTTGNSVLASGGSGDLLTGLIAGLLGRGMEPFEASILAAFVHGRAAEIASQHLGPYGVSPTEIQPFIPKVWEELHAFDAASLDFH
jgi:NAD(P)H-hydrate epimerase